MNRINRVFETKKTRVLSIFFTAGYPELDQTAEIITAISDSGADIIEIGIPFSDPVADGTTIQESNAIALKNGMSIELLFSQLKDIRQYTQIPLILMGYLNPIVQFGIREFCENAGACGIDGLIIPDLPVPEYLGDFEKELKACSLKMIFLVTPDTACERIKLIDSLSDSFIYIVTMAGTTGSVPEFTVEQERYLIRLKNMKTHNPLMAGFGIRDKKGFDTVCEHINGAIIGSSFIRALNNKQPGSSISSFIKSIIS